MALRFGDASGGHAETALPLGLSMAWKIIKEKQHGDVTFDTQVGIGTTFHVRLPVAGVATR